MTKSLFLLIMFYVLLHTINPIHAQIINITNSNSNNDNYDKIMSQIDKSNSILTEINKSINQNDMDKGKQSVLLTNTSDTLKEISQSLRQTNDLLKKQDESAITEFELTQRLENFRSQTAIIAGIEASLIGAAMALLGERYIAKRILKQQINKTHDLINDDLNRIHNNTNIILLEIHQLRSRLKSSQNLQQKILQNRGILEPNDARFLINLSLLHWDAIVSGGYLIKLKTHEIRELQALRNFLEDTRKNCLDTHHTSTDNLVAISTTNQPQQDATNEITKRLLGMAYFYHFTYPTVVRRIQKIQTEINWVTLDNNTTNSN